MQEKGRMRIIMVAGKVVFQRPNLSAAFPVSVKLRLRD